MTRRPYFFFLFLSFVLHFFVLSLFVFNFLPQETRQSDFFFVFHHGGDNYGYYNQAISLITGHFEANQYPLGFPILMIPLIWLLPEASHDAAIQPIAMLWAFILFPVGQLLLTQLIRQITKNAPLALAAAAFWAVLPLIYYFGIGLLWNPKMGEIIAIHSTWAQMLSDGPAALFTLLAGVLFFACRERNYDWLSVASLGSVLGFLGMIRFSGLLIAFVIGALFLLERRWMKAILLTGVALFAFAPQMFYNQYFFHSPFETGYSSLAFVPETGLMSLSYLSTAFGQIWGYLSWLTLPILFIAFGLFFWSLWRLALINRIGALFIGGWIIAYLVFYSLYYYSWTGAFMRFMIPIEPALAFMAVFTLWESYQVLQRLRTRNASPQ